MKKTIYVKYNRIRKPIFQTATKQVVIGDEKYVEKQALCPEAQEHISSYDDKYQFLVALYDHIVPLKGIMDNNVERFPYLKGITIKEMLENSKADMNELFCKIEFYLNELLRFKSESVIDFYNTEEFEEVFGNRITFGCKAVKGADIDIIFDNIMVVGDCWYSFDYEWTFDFPIPVDFLRFRILYRYYCSEFHYFEERISQDEFLKHFGYNDSEIQLYTSFEWGFLHYVFGENCKYSYLDRYIKETYPIQTALTQLGDTKACLELKQNELQGKEQIILNLTNEKNELESLNEKQSLELEQAKTLLEEKTIYCDAITNSISWKITKPIRRVLDKINQN